VLLAVLVDGAILSSGKNSFATSNIKLTGPPTILLIASPAKVLPTFNFLPNTSTVDLLYLR
jgi:hypothetical protein